MFSVTPATDSRLNVKRGFGHRAAASDSARVTSTLLRIARTRGLSALSRASASASERTVWAATSLGRQANAAATHHVRVRIPLLPGRPISRRRLSSRVYEAGENGGPRTTEGARGGP